MSKYTNACLESLAARLDVEEVLADINYRLDTIQRSPDRIKCYCPVHQESILRSLTIDVGRKRFKCGYSLCPASRSGSLLRLWALAKKKEEWEAAEYWARKHRVKLEADPEWKAAAGEAVVEAPPEEKPAPKEKPKKVVPPEAAVARGPAEPPKRGGKLVIRKRRLEPEPAAAVSAAEADALVQAQAAIAAGRLADAARILSVHLAAHPEDLEAVLLSANLLVQQKDRQGAADLLARTLRERRDSLSGRDLLTLSWRLHELEPESAAAIDVMAEIYESRGQQGEALEKWYQSADIWHRRGDRGASMARLERILSLRPDESKALEALAKLHILEKQPEAAVETLLRLARVYLDKDMLGAAGEACQRALKLFPESVPVLLLSSEIHARRGLEAESTQALLSAAAVHEAAGEPLAAVQLLFSSLEKHPERSGLRERLADLLAGMGRRDAAAAEYALLAEHWSERDLLGKAVEAIRRAAELHPENAALRERWLGLLLEKGDHAAAAELLERWAAEAEEAGDFETALACLERLLALAPAGGALRCRLIELWVAAGQAPLGYERLRSFLEDAEARGDAAEREALLALQAKHWPDRGMVEAPESVLAAPAAPVESAVERAAGRLARYRDENERERAAAELPELLAAVVEAGEVERAVALYSETRAWAALPAHVALEFAEMLARAGRGDAAADVLVSAAEEARGAGERSAAEAAYRRAVELDGNNPRVWQARLAFLREDASAREEARAAALALAEVYVRRDQAARALRLLDEVYREDPLAFEVLVRRIELEVEEGHPDRAAALCLEAAAQAPVETALSLLLRATDLSPQDPETWQALYRHHAAAGRVADALSALGTLLDLLERKGLVGKCLALLEEARGALCSGGPEADEAEMTLLLRLARLYEAKGDWRAAAREYLRLAELSERREGIEPALGWVRKGLERDPDFLRLRLVEARLLSRMIPPGDAARRLAGLAATLSGRTARDASADALLDEVLAELLTLSPEHVEGLLLLARRQLEREQPDEARRCYLRACEAAEQTEQWEAALTAAEAVRRLDPQDPEILLRLATLYQRRGEPARAVVCRTQRLEAMLAAWRERPAARRRSAVLSEAEAILALEPGSEAARRARIAVFEKDGETEALRGEWYALLEIQSASGQHLPQLETYRQLLSLEPDNVALRHRFAVHLEGLGRLAEAVEEYLELAERLAESQPMAAEAHWRRALQLEPGCERARQALTAREPEAAAADPLSEADAALAAGDARAAEAVYRQLVLERPREVAVRERLVRLYVSLGDSARAIAEIEELCRLYEEEGRLLETVELLRQAVELEPGRWQLHSALGDRYQRFGNFASAEAAYREALRLLPAGREAERRELHRQLVAVTPGNLESLSTLERCLSEGALSAGERLEADGVRLDILRLLSLEPPSRRVLAEAEQVVGRLTSEGEAAREAHALLAGIAMRVSPAHAGSHRVYLAVQDYLSDRESDALEEAAAALALPQLESVDLAILCELLLRLGAEAEHLGAARRLADRLLSTGRIEEGLAQWRLLVERHPRDLGLRADWIAALENAGARAEAQAEKLALSALHLDLGERVEAIRWCRAALSLPAEEFNRIWEEGAEEGLAVKSPFLPEDVPVLLRLAEIHRAGGRAREEARVWKLLSAHCADLGQSQEAIAYARRVLALAPDDTAAHAQLAALYEATGDAAGALAARVELARVFLAKEAPERALATYRAALERNPDALEVREELASVLADLGRAEESTRELLLVVDHLCAQGRGEEALARLERFVEKDPGSPALREARARQLLALGREVEAVGEYVALGDVYRRLELTRKAQESYERALELDGQCEPALVRLAGVLVDRGRDREAGEQWLRLARLRLRGQDGAGAVEALSAALSAVPEHPAATDLLITTLEAERAAGREIAPAELSAAYLSRARREFSMRAYREALEWARKAVAVEPGNSAASQLQEEIVRVLSRELPEEHLEVRQETLLSLLSEGDTAGALAVLERLILDYPDRVDLARQLAELYREAGRSAEATALLVQQGRRRLDRGEAGVAVELLREAYHHSPENAAVGEVLLEALLSQGEREAARALVVELGRRAAEALPRRAGGAAYQAAARWFRRGVELWPEWEAGYEALIELADKANRPADAVGWLEELLAFLEKHRRHEEALRVGARLLSKLPEPDARELSAHLGRAQEKARRRIGAEMAQADRLVRLGRPEEAAELLMLAAHRAAKCELSAEATQLYARVIELSAQERLLFAALEGQAKLHAAAGHKETAAQVLWSMAPLYERAGDLRAVGRTCRRVVELAPEHRPARERLFALLSGAGGAEREERLACGLFLAQLYRKSDLFGKAEEVYRQLLEEFPGDDEHPAPAFAPLVSLYRDKGEEDRLCQLCLSLAEKSGGRGHFRRQIEYLRQMLKLREDDVEARRRLPGAYYAAGDFEHALAERVNLAILYLRQNQPVQALETIRDILRQDPEHSVILELLDVLVEEEALRGAVLDAVKGQIREFMQESPERARALLLSAGKWAGLDRSLAPLLAAAWAAVGDREEAVRWGLAWAESVAGEKGDASALGPLRQVLAWDPKNPEVAERIQLVEGALTEQRAEARHKSLWQSSLLLFAEERWSEAAAGFSELLSLSPDDAEVKLRLAQALSRLGRAGSEADRERAAGLFLELAEHEDRRGAAARAEEHLDSAVALLPDSLSVRNAQLEFLSRRGEAAALTRAHAELAALYLQAGDEERALSAYRAALALAPERVDLLAATADLLARRNQFSEARDLFLQLAERELAGHRIMAAISAYQRALSFRPDDAEVLDRLAEAYVAKGELSSALAQRRRRIALLREQGRREEMLAEYARLAQLDEENAQLLVEWAEALREADRPGEAVEKLRGAAEKYRGRELLGKAAEIYRGLFEENSRELEAGLLLARCHADMGQAEAAAGVLVEVARRALAVGEAARAEESLRKALEAHPRSRAARRALADFFAGRGQKTDAILWLMQLAALHRESGSPDRAAEVYAEVLEHDPDHEPACRQLLRCLEETGEEKRRLATLERLAGIHERRGATETALEEYLALVDHFLAAAEG